MEQTVKLWQAMVCLVMAIGAVLIRLGRRDARIDQSVTREVCIQHRADCREKIMGLLTEINERVTRIDAATNGKVK